MLTLLIYLCIGLIVAAVAMMLGFGVMNASRLGTESKLGLVAIALPVLAFVVSWMVTGDWITAGVWTALVMSVASVLTLLVSGARNLTT